MPRILLDDPGHSGSSDQLLIGTLANDGTGDQPRVAGQKLKQWATDINVMTAELYTPLSRTAAEIAAGVTPTSFAWPEGDIRRYGALVAASDNSTALINASKVSGAGGSAGYIPPGTWNITAFVVRAPGSSFYGAGEASIIQCANGIDAFRFTSSDAGIIPRSCFFRDFQIIGTLSGTTNAAHGIYINAGVISHCTFENLSILNFQWGIYSTNLYYSTIYNCFIQNCWQGIYFNNQSINVSILDCTIQLVSSGTLITGPGFSTGISAQGAPEIEGLHIQGGSIYGFAYDINLALVFECQINAVDISAASVCPIYFTSVIGPLLIKDCWIELASSGAWSGVTGPQTGGNQTGIFITAITPSTHAKVQICGNFLNNDTPATGSIGLYIGNSNNGIVVKDNEFYQFDTGIGGGNNTTLTGGALAGASIKNNTIVATTNGIVLDGTSTELDLGPNYVTATNPLVFSTANFPASLVYTQPNVPMKGTATFAAATSVAVVFSNAMPYANYRVSLGGNAAGYCWVTSKATTGFTLNCSSSNSNAVDWAISA